MSFESIELDLSPHDEPYIVEFYEDDRNKDALKKHRVLDGNPESNNGVLVIYTGGTIGSAPEDESDPMSPQIVMKWNRLREAVPVLKDIGSRAINFPVDAMAFKKPLDSAKLLPRDWRAMAKIIEQNRAKYDGFVIAHGTDTMVYSASALAFMIDDLDKPVILTGSQLSALHNVRNDAEQNLIGAILMANGNYGQLPSIQEVCIYFDNKLYRGCRTIKRDASGIDAYESPNFDLLGSAGTGVEIREDLMRRSDGKNFRVKYGLERNVAIVPMFPGIQQTDYLQQVASMEPVPRAIILLTYGAGNVDTDSDKLLKQIEFASVEQNILVVNVTECAMGHVEMGLYETSAKLMKYGVVSAWDITTQAALTKLMVILANREHGDDIEGKRDAAQRSLAGEQSRSIETVHYAKRIEKPNTKDESLTRFDTESASFEFGLRDEDRARVRHASLVFHEATIELTKDDTESKKSKRLDIRISVNLEDYESADVGDAGVIESPKKACQGKTLVLDVTSLVPKLRGDIKNWFCVFTGNGGTFTWEKIDLALYFVD